MTSASVRRARSATVPESAARRRQAHHRFLDPRGQGPRVPTSAPH